MILIERKNIDTEKWNRVIALSKDAPIFMYSWYLDAVTKNWAAVVSEDYKTLLPVPFTKKLGVKQMIQAPFTREYALLGSDFDWLKALGLLSKTFHAIHFRTGVAGILPTQKKRHHQVLNLDTDFRKNYSTNAKRILKKKSEFAISAGNDPDVLLNLFKKNVAHKIETLSKQDLVVLKKLMDVALEQKTGELFLVSEQAQVVAAGFFLHDKQSVTYLKGASTEAAKKAGAMYILLDFALQRYAGQYKQFDFGGSDIEKVAEFYHKFGAADRVYYDYTVDDLPFWFKTLKKLKR